MLMKLKNDTHSSSLVLKKAPIITLALFYYKGIHFIEKNQL